LAYQLGSEISENKLANRLKVDRKTVGRFIDLLIKTFVILKVPPSQKTHGARLAENIESSLLTWELGMP